MQSDCYFEFVNIFRYQLNLCDSVDKISNFSNQVSNVLMNFMLRFLT